MKYLLSVILLISCLSVAFAQGSVSIGGTIRTDGELPEGVRVGVHVVNLEGVWGEEIATASPSEGRFSVDVSEEVPADALTSFNGGVVPLPGLQSEYTVSPSDVNFTRGQTNVYIDNNGNDTFDRQGDTPYLGVVNLDEPSGFFVVLYVDKDATLSAQGQSLELAQGWNLFTVRFSQTGEASYEVASALEDAVLDVFSTEPPS